MKGNLKNWNNLRFFCAQNAWSLESLISNKYSKTPIYRAPIYWVPQFYPPKTCYLCKSMSIVVYYLHWWKNSILVPNNSTRLRDESSGPSNEFRQTSRQKQPGKWTHEDYKAAFQLFDKNKDGTITRDELQQVLQTLGQNATKDEMDQFIGDVSFQCYLALL